jgi:hypothetical protein
MEYIFMEHMSPDYTSIVLNWPHTKLRRSTELRSPT